MRIRHLVPTLLILTGVLCQAAEAPLRVFIRGGKKSHGPEAHEHERFLQLYSKLLSGRGMVVDGSMDWPTAEQFAKTDVLVMYAQEGGNAGDEVKAQVAKFTARGGGIVVIHTASVSKDTDWWKSVIGGSWRHGQTKWKEGMMDLYFVENQKLVGDQHPITRGVSNFRMNDEIYYDMDISPDVRVLATSYTPNMPSGKKASGGKTHIYDIQPQMWAYERTTEGGTAPYRAFVSIPGHLWGTFMRPNYRAILLRGIAWAGKRANIDEFTRPEEIEDMLYPAGGPQKPADTIGQLEIHPDFNLTLVTAEPLINKPMNFDWDASGRLWVAETPEYPNGRRGMRPDYRGREWKDHGGIDPTPGDQNRPAHDKISIITDTNGDGVMDKKEVFYEGLDLVTGLVFHQDGVIVTQAPDILFLRDTDRDGKADKVETLYTGLGTGDTHAVINNPRWGWDGWIYATHGYSGSGKVRNPDGKCGPVNLGSGVVRFKPDGSAIEQYSSKGGNTWGLTITGDNRVMWTQPTSGQLLMHTILPEYALARGKVGNLSSFVVVEPSPKSFPAIPYEDLPYVQIDWVGSFTAAAGCAIYDGGSWPQEYNGDYFTTEPTINVIHHTRLSPNKSSFTATKLAGREETEFIRSKDMWWRPIETRIGPDGALYIGDFYNQAVVHNDTRGPDHNRVNAAVRPDRDHYFGRIWRVDHKQAKKNAVPDLGKADAAALTTALSHPAAHVRLSAQRLIREKKTGEESLTASFSRTTAEGRIATLWSLAAQGAVPAAVLESAAKDTHPDVRRNAALVAETLRQAPASALLADADASVRLAALRAAASGELNDASAKELIAAWPKFDDDFQRSAAIGAAARNPAPAITAALSSGDPGLVPLVSQLTQSLADGNQSKAAGELVIRLAETGDQADALKKGILDTLGRSLKTAPEMSPALAEALSKLLASGASASALTVAAKWDVEGKLKGRVQELTQGMVNTLTNDQASENDRLNAAKSLLGLRTAKPEVVGQVAGLLGASQTSNGLKKDLILALGETGSPEVGAPIAAAFASLGGDAQLAAFDVLLKRADWSGAMLDALATKKIDVAVLGPANAFRLRTHPDRSIADRAVKLLDELRGPAIKQKNDLIAQLTTEVVKPGSVEKGKVLFAGACGTCHKIGNEGRDVGPALTGMGAHGPAELLVHIIDPNREVDPSFVNWNIETRDGQLHAGVIVRENPSAIVLRSLAGEVEIKTANIKSRVNTGRSLMPEGFEGLGPEALRDMLAYICAGDAGRFRMLDLKDAFTASTDRGFYLDDGPGRSLNIEKAGVRTFGGVPFNVVTPDRSPNGRNIINLKGGPAGSYSKKMMPRKVEIPGGSFKANRLHFLGGIGGWAFPFSQEEFAVMTATVRFADGDTQVIEMKNGVEIADHIARNDVPGSAFAQGVSQGFQVRWFTKALKKTGEITSIVLESMDNIVAPTTLAVTAEFAEGGAAPQSGASAPPAGLTWGPGTRVLLVGGGSSHDFGKFFNGTDSATLTAAGFSVQYTESSAITASELKNVDVLLMSTNQGGFPTPEFRAALTEHTEAGKGVVLLHPAVWYNWGAWPDYNARFVAGGSKGHDRIREFKVTTKGQNHPLLKDVPASFAITDELYYVHLVPDAPVDVLLETEVAEGTKKAHPSVWVVKHPKARIACIALGHDARAHDLPAFKTLLTNAANWASGK